MNDLIERAKVVAHQHVGASAVITELIAALETNSKPRRAKKVVKADGDD